MQDLKIAKKRKAPKSERKKVNYKPDLVAAMKKSINVFIVTGAMVLSALIIQGCWSYLSTASYFALSDIRVGGNKVILRGDVMKVAGIANGDNIFSFDIDDMGRRIEEMPWVEEVSLERRFPDALFIEIKERTPLALIKVKDLYYVDRESYIYAKAKAETGLDFPIISGIDVKGLLAGDRKTFALLEKGINFLQTIKGREGTISWDSLSELIIDKKGGMTIYPVNAAIPLYLGENNFDERLKRAERVLSDLAAKGIRPRRVDVDFKDRALVKIAI